MVQSEDFPEKYHKAIYSQYAIGWDNFFGGKISQEWLALFEVSRVICGDKKFLSALYIWGANIVEITI